MKFGNREGPATYTKPSREVRSCFGCKHHEHNMTVHRFAGPNEYEDNCNHPQAYEEKMPSYFRVRRLVGHDNTPGWCPYLREKK